MAANRGQVVAEAQTARTGNRKIRRIRNFSLVALGVLILQYLLGMLSNLFVNFPIATPSIKNPLDNTFTNGPYLVAIHVIVGIALGLLSITLVVLCTVSKKRSLILISIAGLGSILFAGESGIEFVLGWYLNNLLSFMMSVGFILAFLAFFLLLWRTNQKQV